jgi:hypothetical protein
MIFSRQNSFVASLTEQRGNPGKRPARRRYSSCHPCLPISGTKMQGVDACGTQPFPRLMQVLRV